MAGPLEGVDEIVYAVRNAGSPKIEPHWYANIGYYAHDENLPAYFEGGRLEKLSKEELDDLAEFVLSL